MSLHAGAYSLGPDHGRLWLKTGRTGAAAKAGHDLLIDVTSWEATLVIGEDLSDTTIALTADGGSLRVREGAGGIKALTDKDKSDIATTIDDEILKRQVITFRSTRVVAADDSRAARVEGELTLLGKTRPVAFDLSGGDGTLAATAVIRQTEWGITPYSTLFGALKLADEVEIGIDVVLPTS